MGFRENLLNLGKSLVFLCVFGVYLFYYNGIIRRKVSISASEFPDHAGTVKMYSAYLLIDLLTRNSCMLIIMMLNFFSK